LQEIYPEKPWINLYTINRFFKEKEFTQSVITDPGIRMSVGTTKETIMKTRILKTSCVIIIMFLITGMCNGSGELRQWSRIWGSANIDKSYGVSVDTNGNIYVAGYTLGEFDGETNTGYYDSFLTKYNFSGIKQWTRIWGSVTGDFGKGVSADSGGNIYVVGNTQGEFAGQTNSGLSDAFLTKYNSGGAIQWTRIWGSDDTEWCEGVSVDSDGNIYAAGYTYGEFDGQTNAGLSDIFLKKYNSSGIIQWSRIWGSIAKDFCLDVSVDSDGNIYAAGFTKGEFDGQINNGNNDIFLTKYNSSGTKQWSRIWGSTSDDDGRGVSADSEGNIYVTGNTKGGFDGQTNAGNKDIFLTKYNSSVTRQWSRIWGNPNNNQGSCASTDTNGNIFVAGYTYDAFDGQTNTGNFDSFLTKYNNSGIKQWTRIWGSDLTDYCEGVSVDSGGNCYASGFTWGEFDGQTNSGINDIFFSKFANPVPFVDITNSGFSVELPATTATIGGTNNEFIAMNSSMWWENTSTSGVSGTYFADVSRGWAISGIALTPDANIVTVSGSNIFGDVSTDSITIDLIPEPMGIWIMTAFGALLRKRKALLR